MDWILASFRKCRIKRFGKDTVTELHYVSLVLKDKTVTLVFHTIEERRKWKGYITQYLELGMLWYILRSETHNVCIYCKEDQ